MAFILRVLLILTARCLSVIEGVPALTVDVTPSNYSSIATLKCSDASYTSGSGYSWTKDGVTIFNNAGEISTSGKYSEGIDGTTFKLIINNLVTDDEASYICNYAFQDSNTLTLEIESRGEVTAELSEGKLEVVFSEIYPSTIAAVITCGSNQVNGAFITNTSNGDRFDRKWESTNSLVADDVNSGCSASVTLRTTFTTEFTVSTDNNSVVSDGLTDGAIIGIVFGSLFGVLAISGSVIGITYILKKKNATMENERQEKQPMTDIKTDV